MGLVEGPQQPFDLLLVVHFLSSQHCFLDLASEPVVASDTPRTPRMACIREQILQHFYGHVVEIYTAAERIQVKQFPVVGTKQTRR